VPHAWHGDSFRVGNRQHLLLEQCQSSFGVERSDRIEAHGAQRSDATGGDGDGGEHRGHAGKGGEIVGRDTVKKLTPPWVSLRSRRPSPAFTGERLP